MTRSLLLVAVSIVATNTMPARGDIGANYFPGLRQSQVWMNLEPQSIEPGPNPFELNVTVAFPGRALVQAPVSVDLRAEAYCLLYPLRVRQPQFSLTIDGAVLDLATPNAPFQLSPSCGHDIGSNDVVVAPVPFEVLQQMAAATVVEVRALGFAARLSPADLRALRVYVAAVADGVTVR